MSRRVDAYALDILHDCTALCGLQQNLYIFAAQIQSVVLISVPASETIRPVRELLMPPCAG